MPVFFLMVGGLISYLCLRKQDPPRARKSLIVGAVLTAIPLMLLGAMYGVVEDEIIGEDVHVPNLTDEQIKQMAVAIPYDSLMEEPKEHAGKIIKYEGNVFQVQDRLNSHVMLVSPDSPSGNIWSNFEADTSAKKQLLGELKRDVPSADVSVWGKFTGLRDYDTWLGGTNTVPEVDVYILEKLVILD